MKLGINRWVATDQGAERKIWRRIRDEIRSEEELEEMHQKEEIGIPPVATRARQFNTPPWASQISERNRSREQREKKESGGSVESGQL